MYNRLLKNNDGKPNDKCLKNGRNYVNYGWQKSLDRMKKIAVNTNQTKARIT